MTPEQLRRWAEQQTQALIALGVDAIEAERSVQWVLDHLPPGADPNTYVFAADTLNEPLDQEAVANARAAWYAGENVPARFKRLLDARLEL
jgi:hypothetical protein